MQLVEIAAALGLEHSEPLVIHAVSIDSRKVNPGDLFIALKGERFDGHDFVNQAIEKGAAAILCEHLLPNVTIPQLVVKDSIAALAIIAKLHRQAHFIPTIALTGSNGKTTVKEMISAILPQPSHASKGNLNNHLGLPLSILGLQSQHRYAVFELGANHQGEVASNVAIVKPQVTLINNIGPAHIQGFGSIEGVARAKGEIYEGLQAGGTAIVNEDDAYAHFWDPLLKSKKVLRFSQQKPVDITLSDLHYDEKNCGKFTLITPKGKIPIQLCLPGSHTVSNALAAAACTYALGISLEDIQKGLNHFNGVPGRLTFIVGKNKAQIIDDTYNANLRSVLAALSVLEQCKGNKIFVFGDMGELGESSLAHHQEVGKAAQRQGIDRLLTYGKISKEAALAFGPGAQHYTTQDALIADVLSLLNAQTTVLVKGSRSSQMEKIVQQLI